MSCVVYEQVLNGMIYQNDFESFKKNYGEFERIYQNSDLEETDFIRPGILLSSAVQIKNDTRFTEFLILHGAPLNACIQEQPIFLAIRAHSKCNVEMLIKHGCNLNVKCKEGYTPLCESMRLNKYDIFKLLLDSGANPNEPFIDVLGITTYPLYIAYKNNNYDILKMLLEYGANPNINNFYILDTYSDRDNSIKFKMLLLKYGARSGLDCPLWALIGSKNYHTKDFLKIYRDIRKKIFLICVSNRKMFTYSNKVTLFEYLGYPWTNL
jgi:ankyrin repeat protein